MRSKIATKRLTDKIGYCPVCGYQTKTVTPSGLLARCENGHDYPPRLGTKEPISDFYRRMLEMSQNKTHYEGCEKDHFACGALKEINRLAAYLKQIEQF